MALNFKIATQAEELKHNLKELKEWSSEANFLALISDNPATKNAALIASDKHFRCLCDDFSKTIDDIRQLILDITEAVCKEKDNTDNED